MVLVCIVLFDAFYALLFVVLEIIFGSPFSFIMPLFLWSACCGGYSEFKHVHDGVYNNLTVVMGNNSITNIYSVANQLNLSTLEILFSMLVV